MCGIAGIVTPESRKYAKTLRRMTDSIAHRGPDGEGHFFFNRCALGHRRLSIVDLATGSQPMIASDRSIGLVFNGEIYGYKDIRKSTRYPYKTQSDTELLIALYAKYGIKMLSHLPGMFAFALWDEKQQQLFCARDRFGEKPFYYAFGKNGEFLFASEIKGLLASNLISPRLNRQSLAWYMQYLYIHPWQTIYENIHILPPGHSLILHQGSIKIERYWNPPTQISDITFSEATSEFKRLLTNAVTKQLVADVPVGAFLSGGLDSSTIVALASKQTSQLSTYSFDFSSGASEFGYARDVANMYNTNHHELSDESTSISEILHDASLCYDEPFADSSCIPQYLISKLARKHATVVLTGDGSDELLGGYGWYRHLFRFLRHDPFDAYKLDIFRVMRLFYRYLPPSTRTRVLSNIDAISAKQNNVNLLDFHQQHQMFFSPSIVNEFDLVPSITHYEYAIRNVSDLLRYDFLTYMPGDILVKTDRASMAHGLELRSPFLDVDLANFCLALPEEFKVTKYRDKIILRNAFSSLWPVSVRKREKQGFGGPVSQWLQNPDVIDLKHKYLENKKRHIFDVLPYDVCQKYSYSNKYLTWILLTLSLWAENHDFSIN